MGKINFDVWVGSDLIEWKGLPGSDPDAEDVGVTPGDVLEAAGYTWSPEGHLIPPEAEYDDEEGDDLPASQELIRLLGFNPDELFDSPWGKLKRRLSRTRLKFYTMISALRSKIH